MMKNKLWVALLGLWVSLPLYGNENTAQSLIFTQAWVKQAPPGARSLAAYAIINNNGDSDIKIMSVTASGFSSAMLHRSKLDGDIAMMEHLTNLIIPAGQKMTLEPGAMHVMLMMPNKNWIESDIIHIDFCYADDSCQTVDFDVLKEPRVLKE